MANMSYCRFRNTRQDMQDCLDALSDAKKLSEDEAKAGRWMFEEILTFCRENYIISDFDGEMLQDLFDSLSKREDDDDE